MANLTPGNIGADVTVKSALAPVDQAAATSYSLAGVVIDRLGFDSAVFMVRTGAVSGTPDATAIDAKLQECDTSGGTYTDVATSPQNSAVAIAQITAASTEKRLEIDLRGLKQYVKLQFQVVFTGGTTPKALLTAAAALGGKRIAPASQS